MAERSLAITRLLRGMLWIWLILIIIMVVCVPPEDGRIARNEGNAIGKLRALAAAQAQFQGQVQVDQDEDNTGEYGLLNELTGISKVRGSKEGTKDAVVAQPALSYAYISRAWSVFTAAGYTSLSGYYFQVFLPHTGKAVTDTNVAQNGLRDTNSINAQEKSWIAYAWPRLYRKSGISCFVVNQKGKVFFASNANGGKAMYCGEAQTPSYNAAMDKTKLDAMNWGPLAIKDKNKAMDGLSWIPVEEYQLSHLSPWAVLFLSLLGLFALDLLVLFGIKVGDLAARI